jgi:hypothetical protein
VTILQRKVRGRVPLTNPSIGFRLLYGLVITRLVSQCLRVTEGQCRVWVKMRKTRIEAR